MRTKASAVDSLWTNVAANIAYEPFAALRRADYGNGERLLADWGNDGRLAGRKLERASDGTVLSSLAYGYDVDDNITSIADLLTPANDAAFGYDAMGRLTRVTLAGSGGPATGQRTDYGFLRRIGCEGQHDAYLCG